MRLCKLDNSFQTKNNKRKIIQKHEQIGGYECCYIIDGLEILSYPKDTVLQPSFPDSGSNNPSVPSSTLSLKRQGYDTDVTTD